MRTPHGLLQNDQERAWRGEHGDAYNRRSPGNEEANYQLFRQIFGGIHGGLSGQFRPIDTVLELGAGTGANVRALSRVIPLARFDAVEVNAQACEVLMNSSPCSLVLNFSVLDWKPDRAYDLVLSKGLLIHIAPEDLIQAYDTIHQAARRWILLAEYYNPTRVAIPYRGQNNLLWKADYAGEMLERYPDLHLVDYGFVYRRDRYPQDDITWFLLEKRPIEGAAA